MEQQQKQETAFEKINNALKNSVSIKLLSIGFLIGILLIPQSMITSLINERESSQYQAVSEVSQSWAAPIELTGPILTVPFDDFYIDGDKEVYIKRYAHMLPETLNITGDLSPETRKRGIYDIVVYTTHLDIEGNFDQIDLSAFTNFPERIRWNEATLTIGIPDMRGIQSDVRFELGNETYRMEPGIPVHLELDIAQGSGRQQTGVNSLVKIDPKQESTDFSLKLDVRGTKNIMFNPVGKSTHVTLNSSWPHPSFIGQFLPDAPKISEDGFTAEWSVFDLNRNYPQQWVGKQHKIASADFGVTLYQPVDNYQQNERSAKYAVLILFLTFISFFFIEILNKKRIHPVQYVLVGLTLTIFYTLLLSLSEHIGFGTAYLVSAAIIITMLSLYSLSILKSGKLAAFMLLFFSLIYSFIFIILRMEDFALLVGSFGLVFVLGLCMYLSRKVDWYNIKSRDKITPMTS
ncbi:MAG: cell envelope integrity protein CreD [Roseivirga sp.]